MDEFTFDDVFVDPNASRKVTLDLFDRCANFWRPNEQFALNEYVRPTKSTGFAYQAQGDGLSAFREPRWPSTSGQLVMDGSITWVTVPAGTSGLDPISALTTSVSNSALVISSAAIDETTSIVAAYSFSGAQESQEFEAIYDFTLNGVARRARQRVIARRQ